MAEPSAKTIDEDEASSVMPPLEKPVSETSANSSVKVARDPELDAWVGSKVWVFLDGGGSQTPTNLGTAYTPDINSVHWYPGETLDLDWSEDGPTTYERISLTAGGLSVAHELL